MQRKIFVTPPRRVALFITCMVDMIYPEVGIATAELLEKHGVAVAFPGEQTCCGQPAFNAGFREEARTLAHRFLNVFEPLVQSGKVDAIVAPSGSCTTMTSHFYATLFEGAAFGSERRRCEELAAITFELTEFLVDVLGVTNVGAQFQGKLTYHACCHLMRELKVDAQPRQLLENMPNANYVPLAGDDECCGFGGLFSVKNSEISTAIGQRKSRNLAKSGAEIVAMCDVSCMTHINGLLTRQAQSCRAVHIAELLNNQIQSQERKAKPDPTKAHQPRRWQDV